ncbi:MAG: flippase [Candidatus Faecivicinus sp.]
MNIKGKRIVGNTLWLLVGSVFRLIFHFAINILIARYLGPAGVGSVNYIASYTAFFTSICGLGLNGVIIHELVNHPDEDGEIVGTAIALRFVVGIVSAIAMVGVVCALDGADKDLVYMAILQAVQLPFAAFDTVKYWYQRQLQSKIDVVITVIAFIISAIIKIGMIVLEFDYVWFALGTTADVCFLGILYYASYQKRKKYRLTARRDVARRMLRASGPFLLASITAFIYTKIDTIMIKQILHSTEAVGYYSTAITICGYISFIPTAVLDSMRPVIMEEKEQSEKRYRRRIRQLISMIMWVAFAYSAFVTLFGRQIIGILYGDAYLDALTSLRIAVWFNAFSYLGGIKSMWLLCERKNRYVMILSIIGGITDVLCNAAMIPIWGIEGAAVATLVTQMLSNFFYPLLFKDTRPFFFCSIDGIFFRWLKRGKAGGEKGVNTGV